MEAFPFSEMTDALMSKYSKPARLHAMHLGAIWDCQGPTQLPIAMFYPALSPSKTRHRFLM